MLKRYKKGIAVLLLLTFLQEIISPTVSLALTGGPSQPEVQSFEPIGTNQMVDLSTGDFNYNIPLMVVPGPNGGYPINIAYHAGIAMEQEASWVGLGWNINPGAITRNLRGIPDDFDGDKIKKTASLKNDVTVGVGMNAALFTSAELIEYFGFEVQVPLPTSTFGINHVQVYYNNYRGVGYNISTRPMPFYGNKVDKKAGNSPMGNLSLNFNNQTGLGINVSLGIGQRLGLQDKINASIGIHSRQGLQSIRFNRGRREAKGNIQSNLQQRTWVSMNFVNHTYVPAVNNSMNGTNIDVSFVPNFSKNSWQAYKVTRRINASVSINRLKNKNRELAAYGTLYLDSQSDMDDAGTDYDRIMDMNVYNDIPISPRNVNMGVPIMTADTYTITGQGIGGTYRAHRTDVGRMYKTGNVSNTDSYSGGLELGTGNVGGLLLHVGLDLGFGYAKSYSGKWTSGTEMIDDHLKFEGQDINNPLYEPFYFKVAGEQTAINKSEWSYMNGDKPVAFKLGMEFVDDVVENFDISDLKEITIPKPKAFSTAKGTSKTIVAKNKSKERIKRVENIGYKTKEQVTKDEYFSSRAKHIYDSGTDQLVEIPYNQGESKHLQEYNILRQDGATYTYGLPAYNTMQKEKVFANIETDIDPNMIASDEVYADFSSVEYEVGDNDITNDEGHDKYYSSTEIPEYVHANLITQITSADYVDLTDNGPSEDDFGFYTKFNYVQVEDYKWREPYKNANYIKGYYSNELDDKATYTYGEKDLYYTHSIETKTHIAVFELGDRKDGFGVASEDQDENADVTKGKAQKYLKKITLYSKADENHTSPLQTVHFKYDYELCDGILNNDLTTNFDTDHVLDNQGGKLTLKEVYITYNGNEKGRLSPYKFDYDTFNPDYSKLNMDRWGNYQTSLATNEHTQNPYTRQDASNNADQNASAWSLKEVTLPSGGIISVEYEADDYKYVQDKAAMQMLKIHGFGFTADRTIYENGNPVVIDSDVLPTGDRRLKLSRRNLRLWFELPEPLDGVDNIENQQKVDNYVAGIDQVYFKIFQELKLKPDFSGLAKDYVEGYAQIDNSSAGFDENALGYAYVDLQTVTYQTTGAFIINTHPFKKAGWQYLRYSRPDLFTTQNGSDEFTENLASNAIGVLSSMATLISEALNFLGGYYNKAAILQFCRKMNDDKSSFVRLNSPEKGKVGGGHRVSQISLDDKWNEGSREFITTYDYINRDGFTSGVADYEPLLGGEENALKEPVWYNGNDDIYNHRMIDEYVETPFMEAVYPGPRVVYGRVVQRQANDGFTTSLVEEAQDGIIINEFYTSKDFPVFEDNTTLERVGYNLPLFIPFVGSSQFQNNGYSQGYTVTLNDMSGRPKSVATYPYTIESESLADLPISKVEYIYKTDGKGRLNNEVNVLNENGAQQSVLMGVEQDFVINEEQNSNFSFNTALESNLDLWVLTIPGVPPVFVPLPVITGNIRINVAQNMYRGLSTSKVIYKTGILEEVKAYNEGSYVSTNNLLYDAETGEAILSRVTNEWDKPVYNFAYPAHWYYEGMESAYKNYNALMDIAGSAGTLQILDDNQNAITPSTILTLGDEISIFDSANDEYNTFYVTDIDDVNDQFTLENGSGTSQAFVSGAEGRITRSGKRNLQAVKAGSVVALNTNFLSSLSNGLTNGNTGGISLQVLNMWNQYISNGSAPEANNNLHIADLTQIPGGADDEVYYYLPDFYDCSGSSAEYSFLRIGESNSADHHVFLFKVLGSNCLGNLRFENDSQDDSDSPIEKGYIYGVTVDDINGNPVTSYSQQLNNFHAVSEILDANGDVEYIEFEYLPTGEIFIAEWNPGEYDCFEACETYDGILHADATTFSDDWGDSYPYLDLGNPASLSTATVNTYKFGKKGIWRTDQSHVYQVARKQSEDMTNDFKTRINKDGEYDIWHPFDWTTVATNTNWDWVSRITKYSPYGFALEEESRLSSDNSGTSIQVFTSQMYGYDNSVVTATSANAGYFEIGFNGFEQDPVLQTFTNRGHIALSGTKTLDESVSHTGKRSLKVLNGATLSFIDYASSTSDQLIGKTGKDYIVSLWVNVEAAGSKGTLTDGTTFVNTDDDGDEIIDGWKKLELKFTKGAGDQTITYTSTGDTYIDDLRIGPYDGGMKTYVYDRYNLWLVAELDGLNYATFYNYDSEGQLVQVKKETEKGIVTIQTAISNTQIPD